MGTSFKNLVFGGGSKPKKGNISGLVFGDSSKKPKKSAASSLIFGGPKKQGRTGMSALVFGNKKDDQKPRRSGLMAMAFGTGKSTKYEPDDYLSAQSMRPKRRLTRGDFIEGKSLHKRVRDYNRKHSVSAKIRIEGEKNFRNIKIKDGKLGDIMKSIAEEERFVGRTERSAANQIENKKMKYRDEEGNTVEVKFDRTTRRKLAKIAVIKDFERPSEEIPQAVKNARIAASRATDSIANKRNEYRNNPRSRDHGTASRIGAKTIEDVSKKSGFAQLSKSDKTSASSDKQHGTASIEQGKEAKGVGESGLGANKTQVKDKKSSERTKASASGGQPVVISGAAGMTKSAKSNDVQVGRVGVNDYFYSSNQIIGTTGKSLDFKKLIEEKKAADEYEEEREKVA